MGGHVHLLYANYVRIVGASLAGLLCAYTQSQNIRREYNNDLYAYACSFYIHYNAPQEELFKWDHNNYV